MHKTFFKKERVIDGAWLVFQRTLPCLVAGHPLHQCFGSVCAHHSLQSPFKGMACKGSDNHSFEVCDGLHKEIHLHGNEDAVLRSYGVIYDMINRCENKYKDWKNGL